MRKLFLLIPLLAFALMANAAIKTIGPDDPTGTVNNALIGALSSASDDDVIILKGGTYNESSDYLVLNKKVEIKAADGATPVIKLTTYIKVQGGKHSIMSGLTFDGSVQGSSRDQYFRFYDAADNELELNNCTFNDVQKNIFRCESGKKLVSLEVNNCKFVNSLSNVMKLEGSNCGSVRFDGCEFSGTADIVIQGKAGSHLHECVVNNCYFHNNTKQSIYFEQSTTEGLETCDELTVTNSTFANTTALTNWISVVEIRPYGSAVTDAIKVRVDHCTFYNNPCVDSGHANIRTHYLSDVEVSNCIFMHPTALAQRATYCDGGGTVSNCLTYNFTKDPSNYAHAYGPTVTNCVMTDPLFTDAANGDFTFANNWTTMNISPACGSATDGTDLGDPRWYSNATMPTLSLPYNLNGNKANLLGNIRLTAVDSIQYYDKEIAGIASWKIHVENGVAIKATIDMAEGSNSGATFKIMAFDAKGNKVDSLVDVWRKTNEDIVMPGSMYLPEGDYVIRLYNAATYSKAIVDHIQLSYFGGAVQNLPCTTAINEAWFGNGGTREDGQISFSSWNNENSWIKWNAATTADIFCNVTLRINTTNAHHFAVDIYEEGQEEAIATLSEKYSETTGENLDIDLGRVHIANDKKLLIKVTNPVGGSAAKVVSLKFEEVVIPTIELPNPLLPADAMLSERAWVDNDSLLFTARGDEGYNSSQWAKWKIHTDIHGYYKFTLNAYTAAPAKAQQYILTVLSNDESQEIAKVTSTWNNTENEHTAYLFAELAPGNYIVKVQNPEWGSKGRVMSIVPSYEGGAFTELPGQLLGNEAMLHATKLSRDANNDIVYGDNEHPRDEYVAWNIHADAAVELVVTLNLDADNLSGHNYVVELCQNGVKIDSVEEASGTNFNPGNIEITAKNLNITAAGNYQIKLINRMPNSENILHGITFDEYVAPQPIIIDEEATSNGNWADYYDTNEPIDLSIIRTLKGGMYNTICLPFELGSTGSMENAFGAGYELLKLTGATFEGGVLDLTFEQKETLEYGVPYLIKPVADVVNPSFTGRKIKTTTASTLSYGTVDFIGTFIVDQIPAGAGNLFLGMNNTLYFPTGNIDIKGMRAWFRINIPNANQVVRHARIVAQGQVVTAIDLVNDANEGTTKTIENGQLVIIRDGVRYNVMGLMIK